MIFILRRTYWLGLVLFLGFTCAFAQPTTPPEDSSSEKTFTIYVATWRGCEEACQGVMAYLQERGLNAEFILRDAEQQHLNLLGWIAEIRELQPDLVLTWGPDVTLGIVGPYDAPPDDYIRDRPVVFMYVAEMVNSKIVAPNEAGTSGRPNVAATDYVVPLGAQINAIRDYRPLTRLGLVYDPTQSGSVQRRDTLAELGKTMDYLLVAEPLVIDETGSPSLAALPEVMDRLALQHPDFVHFGFSSFLVVNVAEFTRLAVERNLPIFSAGAVPLQKDRGGQALLGLFNSLRSIGVLAGIQIEEILRNGRSPGELPIARFNRFSMQINMPVALELELYPPMGLMGFAELLR